MKTIKQIIREEINDFDWTSTITYDKALKNFDWMETAAEIFTGKAESGQYDEDDDPIYRELSDKEIDEKSELLEWYLANHYFSDIVVKGKKIFMEVGHWEDFAEMFEDSDSQYNYMGRSLAKAVLAEDDYYEPYYGVVQDWYDEVWGEMNPDSIKQVIDFIREKYVGDDMSGYRTIEVDGEEVELTEDLLQSWIGDSDVLGTIIRDVDEFEEIKHNLERAYETAYNDVSRNQIWESARGAITDLFGEGNWESKVVKKYDGTEKTNNYLLFDITNIFWDIISAYFENHCDFDYNRECDFEHVNFFDNVSLCMYEEYWEEELNPRFDEYPDHREVSKYFNEMVGDYLYY